MTVACRTSSGLTWSRCPTANGLNPQRRGMVADISPEVLFIAHAGDSAVTTVTMERYTLYPLPSIFYALLAGSGLDIIHECAEEV